MKKFLVPSIFMAAILGACSSGSSSSSEAAEEVPSVETEDDLPNCTSKREGETIRVKENDVIYTCHDGSWGGAAALPDEYETEDDLPNCTSKKEGQRAIVKETSTVFVCKDGEWEEESKTKDSEDDLGKCTAKREGEKVLIKETGETVICTDGSWKTYEEEEDDDTATMTLKQAKAACDNMDEEDKAQLAEILPETVDLLKDFMNKSVNSKTVATYQKQVYSDLLKQNGGKNKACPVISMGYGVALLSEAMNNSAVAELRNAYENNDYDDWWWLADENYVGRILKTIQQASYDMEANFTKEAQQTLKKVAVPSLDSAISFFAPVVALEKFTYEYESDDYVVQLDQSEFATVLGAMYALKGLFTAAICVDLDISNNGSFDWIDGYLGKNSNYGYADAQSMKFVSKLMNDQTMFTKVYDSQKSTWKSIPDILKKGITYVKKGLNHSLNDTDQDYDLFVIGDGRNADFSSSKIQEYIDNADTANAMLSGTATVKYGDGKSVKVNLKKFFEQTDGFMKYMPYMECDVNESMDIGECYFTDKNGNIKISLSEAKNGDYPYGDESSLFIFKDPTFGGVFPAFTQTSIWNFIRDFRD